jgi:hypothetical protein
MVGFCTESKKDPCQDTPALGPTDCLYVDRLPNCTVGDRGSINERSTLETPQLSIRIMFPDYMYTVWIYGRSTRGGDGPIHNLLAMEDHIILGSSRDP